MNVFSEKISKSIVVLAISCLLLFSGCSSKRELIAVGNSKNAAHAKSSIINNGIIGDTNIITGWTFHSYVIAIDGTPLPRFTEEKKDFLGLTTEANLNYAVKAPSGDHELIISLDFERSYAFVRRVRSFIGNCRVNLQEGHEYVVRSQNGREIDQVVIDLASDKVIAYCDEMTKAASEYKYQALKGFLQSIRRVGP